MVSKFQKIRLELAQLVGDEELSSRALNLVSADWENVQCNLADHRFFKADQFWASLNQGCSELKASLLR